MDLLVNLYVKQYGMKINPFRSLDLSLDIFQLLRHRGLRMFRLKVLLVGLGVGHGGLADGAGELEAGRGRLGVVVLAVPLHLLQLRLLLRRLRLRLLCLESTSHYQGDF